MAVSRVTELVQEGLRRKLCGDTPGAAEAWRQALAIEPANQRARTYLEALIASGAVPAESAVPSFLTPAAGPEVPAASPLPWQEPAVPAPSSSTPVAERDLALPLPGPAAPSAVPLPGPSQPAPWALPESRSGGTGALPWETSAPSGFVHAPREGGGSPMAREEAESEGTTGSTISFGSPAPAAAAQVGGAKEFGVTPVGGRGPGSASNPPLVVPGIPGFAAPVARPAKPASPFVPAKPASPFSPTKPASPFSPSRPPTPFSLSGLPNPLAPAAPASPFASVAAPAAGSLARPLAHLKPAEPAGPAPAAPVSSAASAAPAEERDGVERLLRMATDLLALDDHSGALEAAEKVLAIDPANPTARELVDSCQRMLQAMFESKIGDMSASPKVLMRPDEIVWLTLDHRAGFLLAMIDGQVTYDDLFALSSMTRVDTARILAKLLQDRVIG